MLYGLFSYMIVWEADIFTMLDRWENAVVTFVMTDQQRSSFEQIIQNELKAFSLKNYFRKILLF